jgi:hypothetical protein
LPKLLWRIIREQMYRSIGLSQINIIFSNLGSKLFLKVLLFRFSHKGYFY